METFKNAFESIQGFFQIFNGVPSAVGFIVDEIPYLGLALGLSVVFGFLTWIIKSAIRM